MRIETVRVNETAADVTLRLDSFRRIRRPDMMRAFFVSICAPPELTRCLTISSEPILLFSGPCSTFSNKLATTLSE